MVQTISVSGLCRFYLKFANIVGPQGFVWGTLHLVSANSFMDEKNKPYFKGQIQLEHDYVGHEEGKYRVAPGMTVNTEIITGEKTLLQYMLKPIFTQLHESFHER